jgi:hypothetical protein
LRDNILKTIPGPTSEAKEIKEIKKAFKNAARIKAGKLKSGPVEELLNSL